MADDGSVAIVGMACRFPGAADLRQYWAALRDGAETIERFSPQQLAAAGVPAALAAHPDYVPAGGVLAGGDRFDWAHFGYSPGEAAGIDPQHRVLLECAATALEDAALDPDRFPGLVGVFAGCDGAGGHRPGAAADPAAAAIGWDSDFLATRVAYKLGLRGPALTVQTACSTSLVAVHLAAQHLLNYECDAALAGGVSLVLPQTAGYRYREGHILSPDGHCRPFDAAARGTVPSSGAGLVVLRRLGDALADGDRVVAVIRGSAVNNDGAEKVGYSTPSVAGQRDVIRMALARADADPGDIGYVEAHGTATPVGDPVEVAALAAALDDGTGRTGRCWLGAVKGNIGHTGAAAGVAGLIKTAAILAHRELVPTVHFRRPNPGLGLAESPFRVSTGHAGWQPAGTPLAGVSAFGIGGTNAHVVLEAAPGARPRAGRAGGSRLLCLSAASPQALTELRAGLAERLPEHDLPDVELTLAVGRRQRTYRVAQLSADAAAGAAALREPVRAVAAVDRPRLALLLPGRAAPGSATGAAARALLPEFRRAFDAVQEAAGQPLDGSPWPLDALGQLRVFALGYALGSQLTAWAGEPVAILGEGAGEYAAAALAGVWTLPDAVALVRARGQADADTDADADADAAGLRAVLAATATRPPRLPLVCGLTGGWAGPDQVRDPEYWVRRLRAGAHPGGVDTLLGASPDLVLELGPGTGLLRGRAAAGLLVPLLGPDPDAEHDTLLRALGTLWSHGVPVAWDAVLAGRGGRRCALPPHPLHPLPCEPVPPPAAAAPRPGEVLAAVTWPAGGTAALSARPDLRAALDAYCGGLVGDLVLRRLGGPGPVGAGELRDRISPAGRLPRLVEALVAIAVAEGWLRPDGAGYTVPERAAAQVAAALAERSALAEVAGLRRLLEHCAAAYPDVLDGSAEPVSVLFPGADDALLAGGYAANAVPVQDAEPCLDALVEALRRLPAGRDGGPLRVLEVGAGRGDLAARVRAAWPDPAGLAYQLTDVSPLQLRRARERLPALPGSLLDITRDPVAQGFAAGGYDVVLAGNVLHVAPDVRAALRNLGRLLAPGGWLGLVELTRVDRWSTLIWGLAPGWWDFADDLRRDSPALDAPAWLRALADAGFEAGSAAPPGRDADHVLLLATRRPSSAQPTAQPSAQPIARPIAQPNSRPVAGGALAGLWAEVLGVPEVRGSDDFFGRGGDSLMAVNLVAQVEDRLGVRVALGDFTAEPTFGRLAELVAAGQPGPGPAPAPNLLTLHGTGDRAPLFLVAPAAGSSLGYRRLAGLLGGDRPVHGLDLPGLHDGGQPLDRLGQLARYHADLLLERFPAGPYLLGGWSVGAMAAHELACQLAERGAPVPLLVCIDGHLPDTGGRPLGSLPAHRLRGLRHRLRARRVAPTPQARAVYRASLRAMLRYRPRPAPCPVVIFQTGLGGSGRSRLAAAVAPLYPAGVRIRPVPGDHWTVLHPPQVAQLAAGLREVLP